MVPWAFHASEFTQPWWPCTLLLRPTQRELMLGNSEATHNIQTGVSYWSWVFANSAELDQQFLDKDCKCQKCFTLNLVIWEIIQWDAECIHTHMPHMHALTFITLWQTSLCTKDECICNVRLAYGSRTGNGTCPSKPIPWSCNQAPPQQQEKSISSCY